MITISQSEFRQLADLIERQFGIHMNTEKQSLLTTRLQELLIRGKFQSFSDYVVYLRNDRSGIASRELIDRVTTNHTYFMREWEHFVYLRDTVLPALTPKLRERDLRVWSAGCSTGEEPYTLAMLFNEYFGSEKFLWDSRILATDISTRVLEKAERGIYPHESLVSIPAHWKRHFITVDQANAMISKEMKQEVIFRRFNLMEKLYPYKRPFHLIFCRNVMIYFDQKTKMELVNRLYDWTEPGGYLFIGHSETLNRNETAYEYVQPSIYRKPLR